MFGPQSKLVGPFHLDQGNRLVKRHPSWGVFTKVSKGLLQMNFVPDNIFCQKTIRLSSEIQRLATEAYDSDAEAFYDAFLEYLDY